MTLPRLYGDRAELYDLTYSWKDFAGEAEKLHALLAAEGVAEGARLLDAACGTGAHLAHLARWYDAAGLDLSGEMLAVAPESLVGRPVADLFLHEQPSLPGETEADSMKSFAAT